MRYQFIYALIAATLFGLTTPLAKLLITQIDPWLLAGLLYLGAGAGIYIWQQFNGHSKTPNALTKPQWLWLLSATFFGGIVAPIALMYGLAHTPAATSALLLNIEVVLTSLIAWYIFKEHIDRRVALGIAAVVCGGIILSWQRAPTFNTLIGPSLILLACCGWAIDNNLTRQISAHDPLYITKIKSLVAGTTNVIIALTMYAKIPAFPSLIWALLLGFIGYGVSLVFFILSLRNIGTSRTGAYFSTAPFIGAVVAIVFLGESITAQIIISALFMAIGCYLFITEKHAHTHTHKFLEHTHSHTHDTHHQHHHTDQELAASHTHHHTHHTLTHAHPHCPDIHHEHSH